MCSGSRFPSSTCGCCSWSPSVFTAHDLLPRRTAEPRNASLWSRLLGKFGPRRRAYRAWPRGSARALAADPVVIPHPVYPSEALRTDNGQTILALGVIRPYKGLADAVEVVSRLSDARLLVAGDPAMPLDGLRDQPLGPNGVSG